MRRLLFPSLILLLIMVPFAALAQNAILLCSHWPFCQVDGRAAPQKDRKKSIGRKRQGRAW